MIKYAHKSGLVVAGIGLILFIILLIVAMASTTTLLLVVLLLLSGLTFLIGAGLAPKRILFKILSVVCGVIILIVLFYIAIVIALFVSPSPFTF